MKTPKFNVQNFIVKGRGEFPLDMLRYDSCCPGEQEDISQLIMAFQPDSQERIVGLRRFYPVGGIKLPTEGRWRSFGWEVVS